MDLQRDFEEMLSELSSANVRFLVVGAFAVIHYTEPRYTKDLDVWVDPTPANAERVWRAMAKFGAPLRGITPRDFTNPDLVYQLGIEPNRIDIMSGIDGCTFEEAWRNRVRARLGGVTVGILGKADLVRSKTAAGRPEDLLDIQRLTAALKPRKTRKRRR